MKNLKETQKMVKVVMAALIMVLAAGFVPAQAGTPTLYDLNVEKECYADQNQTLFLLGVARLHVPAGALSEPTVIKMNANFWVNTDDPALLFEFAPHNTVFNQPVTLTLSFLMAHFYYGDQIGIYYYDDVTEEWILEDVVDLTFWNTSYEIELNHFSLYAFSRIKNGD